MNPSLGTTVHPGSTSAPTPDVSGELVDHLSSPVTAGAVPQVQLTEAERHELFALLSTHFDGVTAAQFASDLNEKDWVLRIRRGDRLLGFTTLQLFHTEFDGRPINVVYSGDTITEPEVWQSLVLARSWIAMVRQAQRARADEPWYWLLLSSGYRTYRFLPLFWRTFWPCHDTDTPPDAARLLNQLARERFGEQFIETAGVVRFRHPQTLGGALADIPEGKQRDPHVAHFLTRNPGHARGDELVCLTDLGDHNLTPAGLRMARGWRNVADSAAG